MRKRLSSCFVPTAVGNWVSVYEVYRVKGQDCSCRCLPDVFSSRYISNHVSLLAVDKALVLFLGQCWNILVQVYAAHLLSEHLSSFLRQIPVDGSAHPIPQNFRAVSPASIAAVITRWHLDDSISETLSFHSARWALTSQILMYKVIMVLSFSL